MIIRQRLIALFISVVMCVFAPLTIYSQDSSSSDTWYYGAVIKSVTFKGLKNVRSKELEGVVSGFYGKKFNDEVFADMMDRIYALDLFDEINPEAIPGDMKRSTVTITFFVTEKPAISRILVSGNRQLRTAEIKESITSKEKDIFVASKLPIDERAIRDHYLEKGFTNIKVSSSTKKTAKGIEITYTVDEGHPTVIAHINFSGNKIISSKTLKKKIKLKEIGIISKGAFQESMLEADRQAILAYYANEGYIDADVIDITQTVEQNDKKKRDELTITFVISEGSQYTYEGVSFVGNRIFSDEELQSKVKLKKGSVFDQTKFNEGIMAVADLYYENGYTSNRFQQIPEKDVEKKTISYQFMVMENVRSHVEDIIIKGNTRTKEHVIRREIPIESGDIFSKAKVTTGLRNLYNLQYFSAVVPDIVPGSEENLVDLIVSVEEQSTTSIEFGVTFSGVSDPDELPFALFVKWQDSNFKGSGRSISASSTVSTGTQSVGLSYGTNWFGDLPISTSISTEIAHSSLDAYRVKINKDGTLTDDSYYMDYEQWRWSSGFTLGRRWTPDFAILSWTGGITTSLKNNIYDEDVYYPTDAAVSKYANHWGWQNSIWTAFSIDDRDVNYDPSKGWFASQKFTWYGLTPYESEYFLRTDTKLEKYFTLLKFPITENWTYKLVFMAYSGLSLQFPKPGTGIGDTSKLHIDGMFIGRGWTSIYNKVMGKALWNNIVELRMPLVPGVLALDLFGDAVIVKSEPKDIMNDITLQDFYFSVGPGIRFTIPQFPLRLLFANTFRINDEKDVEWDKNWKFVLSFNIPNK
ncbi:outer membrane protein assembly factor BamA [Treponema sp. UBA3813]|uniref:outer membrane protein assembly factor BamA n=1 Tax=Treponema sp. UBA3813 TaxID=1947715 RepID=UPI0025ED5BF7|nr:outer membrane protein assembly factor BamA [Treponema sp. UBA3813]